MDLVIDVPENATSIVYRIDASGPGTLLVDDVELEIVNGNVPLTVMPRR